MSGAQKPRFARTPIEVLTDQHLTHRDVRVYAALSMHAITSNLVYAGQRQLAEMAHVGRRSLRKSLENLARRGYLSTSVHRMSGRAVYQLNSAMFVQERAMKEIWEGVRERKLRLLKK